MPQVSVVIPVYNIEAHLRECLDSVASQTLRDIEIICVDDGSTDDSPAILAEYAAKDTRFYVITQQNAGPGAARNVGMAIASGEYLIFLDSDDWFEPTMLEDMLRQARKTGADVTICKAVEFDTNTGREFPSEWMLKTQYLPGEVFSPEEAANHLFQFTYGMPWDKLYRREQIIQSKIKFPNLRNSEDLAFVFPSLLTAKRIAVLEKVLLRHRINRRSSVSNSRNSQPDAPYIAYLSVKAFLESRGVFETYRQSFLNWSMEFLVWHVSNMGDRNIQKRYLQDLRSKWFPELRFEEYPLSYYYSRTNYAKYLLARYAPYRLFRGIVYVYKGMKARRLKQYAKSL